jgi:phosphoribosylformimino-5-aminoimidazole carboxamide ribotide isomerase
VIVIPAVDLRDGKCVQLVGGEYDQESVRLDDPPAVARDWIRMGFGRLHVVDLDAATGRGHNMQVIRDILREANGIPVQVGGGVRDDSRIEELLDEGVTWVVVGTRAVEDRDWLEDMAHRFPARLVVAADVRERQVVTRGWTKTLPLDVVRFVEDIGVLPLAGVLVTAVHLEGQMQGTDLPLMEDVAEASPWPVLASGGVATLDDLRALEHRGIAGAVLGMALYTNAIEPNRIIEEFGA